MMRFLLNTFIILYLFTCTAYGQLVTSDADTVISTNLVGTNFYNDMNTANLVSNINYRGRYKKLLFEIRNSFNSSVTKFSDNFSTDNNNLAVSSKYELTKKLYAGAGLYSKLLTGNKEIDLNKGYNNFFFSSLDFVPDDVLYVDVKAGLKNEKQIDVYNNGISGSLESRINKLMISDFETSGIIHMSADKYSEKTNYSGELFTDVKKKFSEYSDNDAVVRAYTVRTDFYNPATASIRQLYGINNNIQSRYENYVLLSDNLSYRFSKDLFLKVKGMYFLKNIQNQYKYKPSSGSLFIESIYNNKINENLLQAGMEMEYKFSIVSSRFNFTYSEREENHAPTDLGDISAQQKRDLENVERDKNNNSKSSNAYLEVYVQPSSFHTFKLLGSSSLLRYDTESPLNYDDRDELLFNASVAHRYNNRRNFFVETSFEFNSSLLDYIFKEKSSNNNTNKVYKLNSISVFTPVSSVTTKNYFQVLANYTVYKYEDIVSQVQSFSFRQLYLADSTDFRITKKIVAGVYGQVKVYEQGQFNVNQFSVKPITYSDERTLGSNINYEMKEFINVFVGFRHYIRRYYNYEKNVKVLKRTQAIYGPYAGVRLNIRNNSSVYILGGIDKFEASDNSLTNTSRNLIINILWNI
jgi:hypothetical protein